MEIELFGNAVKRLLGVKDIYNIVEKSRQNKKATVLNLICYMCNFES